MSSNFFGKMGSVLTNGWQIIGKAFTTPFQLISNFFPAAQKTVITTDQVSEQPYQTFEGYRPVTKGATTISAPYQSWWSKAYEAGRNLWDGVTDTFMNITVKKNNAKNVNTVVSSLSETAGKFISLLPDYFSKKWGIQYASAGEYTQQNSSAGQQEILYGQETQSNAPGVLGTLADFWNLISGNQPQGTYNIGMPQSAPIPSGTTTVIEPVESQGAINPTMIIMLIGLVVAAFFFLRKRR